MTWLWHSPGSPKFPSGGFSSNSIVEVSHQKDPFGDEHFGMWFMYAKGSGVFLDCIALPRDGRIVAYTKREAMRPEGAPEWQLDWPGDGGTCHLSLA